MEEMNLSELTEEFKRLSAEVDLSKTERENAENDLNLKVANLNDATNALEKSTLDYNGIKVALETMEKNTQIYGNATIEAQRNYLMEAERKMKDAQARVDIAIRDRDTAKTAFDSIKDASEKQNERMDLILASFGFNQKINDAIVNEMELDYDDKLEEESNKRKMADDKITKINEDEEVRTLVENVKVALDEYSKFLQDNFASTDKDVNEREQQLRNAYRSTINELRIKMDSTYNIKMSDQDIANMRIIDPKGRYTITPLNNDIADIDTRRGIIENEKELVLRKMALAREAAKNPNVYDAELTALKEELEKINQDILNKQNEKLQVERNIDEIPEKVRQLTVELNNARQGTDNTQAIKDLEDQIAKIDADIANAGANLQVNPERTKLEADIAELEKRINNPKNVQRQEYTDAENELIAKKEKLANLAPSMSQEDKEKIDGLDKDIEGFKSKIEEINSKTDTTELKEKKDKLDSAEEAYKDALKELEEARNAEGKTSIMNDFQDKDYVSEDTTPNIAVKGTEENKLFEAYKRAELRLRQVMLAAQKDPSDTNVKAIETAMKGYKTAYENLATELSKGRPNKVSMAACHDYLLENLSKENPENLDPAYNSKEMSNRLRVLEAINPKLKKYDEYTDTIQGFPESMERAFNEFVTGNADDYKSIKENLIIYSEAMKKLEGERKLKLSVGQISKTLKGEGVLEPTSFISKLFGRKLPQPETEFDFESGRRTMPDDVKKKIEELRNIDQKDSVKTALEKAKAKEKELKDAYKAHEEAKLRSGASLTQYDRETIRGYEKKIKGLEAQKRSIEGKYGVDPAIKEALEKEIEAAEEKLKNIEQYEKEDVTALQKQRDELIAKRATTPEKIGTTVDVAALTAKKAELSAKVTELQKGGRDEDKIKAIEEEIARLSAEGSSLPAKMEAITKEIESLEARKADTERKHGAIAAAKEKIQRFFGKFINIKDAGRISYNSDSQRVDRTLIDNYKADVIKDAKDDEAR